MGLFWIGAARSGLRIAGVLALCASAAAQTPVTPAPAPAAPVIPPAASPVAPAPSSPAPAPLTPAAPAPAAPAAPPAPGSTAAPAPVTPDDASAVQTIDIKPRPALLLAGSSSWDDGYASINAALAKVKAAAAKAGLKASGRPIAAFVDTDDNGFKFEAMLPIDAAPEGKTDLGDGVKVGATPAGKALKFQHRGAYDDVDTTYEAITAYLDEKGLEAQNVFVEEYLNDPKSSDDTSAEIEIYVFIK